MINNTNNQTLQPESLILNSNKFNNSSQSLNTSSSSSLNSRSPFFTINSHGSVSSLTSQLSNPLPMNNQATSIASPQIINQTPQVDQAFNKYNHLTQYQHQLNFLNNNQAPFNLNNGQLNNVLSPGNTSINGQLNNNSSSLSNSFNNSLTFFRNNTPVPLGSLHRISAPNTPAPLPPVNFNNPGYFMPPVGTTDQENQAINEQELLDNGFMNLFNNQTNQNDTIHLNKNEKANMPYRYVIFTVLVIFIYRPSYRYGYF